MCMKGSIIYYVYIVHCADNTLYTGICTDIKRRVLEHNTSTKGAKYTRSRRPVSLLYHEIHPDRSRASKREYYIKKKMSKQEKWALIEQG